MLASNGRERSCCDLAEPESEPTFCGRVQFVLGSRRSWPPLKAEIISPAADQSFYLEVHVIHVALLGAAARG